MLQLQQLQGAVQRMLERGQQAAVLVVMVVAVAVATTAALRWPLLSCWGWQMVLMERMLQEEGLPPLLQSPSITRVQ